MAENIGQPEKARLFESRMNPEAETIFSKALNTSDVPSAIRMIAPLVGTSIHNRYEPASYSQSTGEPDKMHWKKYGQWDGRIFVDTVLASVYIGKEDLLKKPLLETLKKGPVLVDDIVVEYVPQEIEQDGTIPPFISFKRVRKID